MLYNKNMKVLFNENWEFSEIPIKEELMYKDGKPVLFNPDDFLEASSKADYESVNLPHDWMI